MMNFLPKHSKKGITLVESVIAVVCLAILTIGIISLLSTGSAKIIKTGHTSAAASEATQKMDLLISAIHAIHYDPEIDGDKQRYAIRTNKILTISQLMSTLTNSAKALLTENLMDIDMGGVLMTFLKVINSTSFWINIKTEYLVSEYKTMIDEEHKKLDKYFH